MRVLLLMVCLMLCAGTVSSRAELHLQPRMDAACHPAAATGYTILHWKPGGACPSGCFVSRLTCANGKTTHFTSAVHPGTTQWQAAFHAWMPWSLALLVLPFLLAGVVAALRTRVVVPLMAANILILSYIAAAGWALDASITANPRAAWLDQLLFLNRYGVALAALLFVLINARPVWAALESLCYRHDGDAALAVLRQYPWQALGQPPRPPQLYEFIDPRETADHYRRETERLHAYRQKLDAETAFAEAYIRRERTRNHAHDLH